MNATNTRKLLSIGLLGFLVLAFVSFVPAASARSDNDNNRNNRHGNNTRLYRITEITKNSAVLPFKNRRFKNETVNAVVSVKTDSTDKITEKRYKVTLDDRGNGSVKVTGLKSATKYKFKVRLFRNEDAKNSEDRGSKNSSSRKASTQ